MKRFVILLLVLASILCVFPVLAEEVGSFEAFEVNADEEVFELMRADAFFDSYYTNVSPQSGKISIYFYTKATVTASSVGVTSYNLYEKAPGGSWVNKGSFSGSTASGTAAHAFERTHTSKAGYQYYVYATHYCLKYDGTSNSKGYTSNTATGY